MSTYGLRKIENLIMRSDTIDDLRVINNWRSLNNLRTISPIRPSVRQLENAVALAIEKIDTDEIPPLVRGIEFYISIIPEIKPTERQKFFTLNQ